MKNKIFYSPEALNDLDEIQEYIELELCNLQAALNVISNILDVIEKLKDFPEMGALLFDIIDIELNYRFVLSGNYMIFYRHENNSIYIDRILYSRRDYMRILFDDIL